MKSIKAIETEYSGYRFRSRLEAKWAVFFDAAGIPYEYEKEGYEIPGIGRYLPDFWLPTLGIWIEIKGEKPSDEEIRKAMGVCRFTEKSVHIFCSDPYFPIADTTCFFREWPDEETRDLIINDPDNGPVGYTFSRSETGFVMSAEPVVYEWNGETVYGQFFTFSDKALQGFSPFHGTQLTLPEIKKSTPQSIVDAYKIARGARFEHGEKPLTGVRR